MALRPHGAGAQLLLLALLARAGLAFDALALVKPVCPTGPDIAQAVRSGRADCGIATRAVAQAAGLDFVPLTWERFDLVLRQRDYFLPGRRRCSGSCARRRSASAPPSSAATTWRGRRRARAQLRRNRLGSAGRPVRRRGLSRHRAPLYCRRRTVPEGWPSG